MSFHDVIIICSNVLAGKPLHITQRKCHSSSAHLLASPLESPVTTATSKPCCLFLNPNFMPVTLFPRYFSAYPIPKPQFICNVFNKAQAGTTSEQEWWMQNTKKNVKGNKAWQVNTHLKTILLTMNLKYLQTKFITCRGGEHRPTK